MNIMNSELKCNRNNKNKKKKMDNRENNTKMLCEKDLYLRINKNKITDLNKKSLPQIKATILS